MERNISNVLSKCAEENNFEITDELIKIIVDLFNTYYITDEKKDMAISSSEKCYICYNSDRNQGLVRIDVKNDAIVVTCDYKGNFKRSVIIKKDELVIDEELFDLANNPLKKRMILAPKVATVNFDYSNVNANVFIATKDLADVVTSNAKPLLETNKFYNDDFCDLEGTYFKAYALFKSKRNW